MKNTVYLLLLVPFVIGAFIAWLFWFPIRLFCFSLIPADAAYAWVGKLVILVGIGWFGGIALPIAATIISFVFIAAILKIIDP